MRHSDKITLLEAFDEFPDECLELLNPHAIAHYRFWLGQEGGNAYMQGRQGYQRLVINALHRVAGKDIVCLDTKKYTGEMGAEDLRLVVCVPNRRMPEDVLRWLLLEVQALRKREKLKEVVDGKEPEDNAERSAQEVPGGV